VVAVGYILNNVMVSPLALLLSSETSEFLKWYHDELNAKSFIDSNRQRTVVA